MSKLTKKIIKKETQVIGFVCDRCGTEINSENSFRSDDFNIKYTFGYGTEYDGTSIDIDICDDCLVSIIKQEIPKINID